MAAEQIKRTVLAKGDKPDPVQYFDSFYQSFQQAESKVGAVVNREYLIQGQKIRLRFAGPALVSKLTPALEHLSASFGGSPSLTICIWDNESTGTPKPRLPWHNPMPRGDVPGYINERINVHLGADLFSILDRNRGLAVYWCADANSLPLYERGAPLRSIFHWWFRSLDIQLVHAGAVGNPNGAVLLAGKGGSGKSTTCLSTLDSDLLYISDDYSLIGLQPQPFVHTLYNTAKLRPDNLHRLPQFVDKIDNAGNLDNEKALFFLQQHYPQKIAKQLPLKAILLPRVSGNQDTILNPANPRDSLSALLLSTMHQLAGTDQKTMAIIKELVSKLPSYHLHLGSDLSQIPKVIATLL